jgi:hypothetical protein
LGLVKKRERKDLEKSVLPSEKQENQSENKSKVAGDKEFKPEN